MNFVFAFLKSFSVHVKRINFYCKYQNNRYMYIYISSTIKHITTCCENRQSQLITQITGSSHKIYVLIRCTCADQESFARGGPNLIFSFN